MLEPLTALLVLLALYLGPLGLLWWLVRFLRQRRKLREKTAARARVAAPSIVGGAKAGSRDGSQGTPGVAAGGSSFSFPLGVPLVLSPLLLIAMGRGSGRWWGYVLHAAYLGLVACFIWQAASRKQFERIHGKDPTMNRETWVFNWLLFFVILPMLAWGACGLPPLLRGLR
jgi:hypothetical protein